MRRAPLDGEGACTNVTHDVRPSDLDSLGHVNHACVLQYFELGRWAWILARFHVASRQAVPVVTEYTLSYRAELFLGRVEIVTRLARSMSYSVIFEHELHPLTGARPGDPAVTAKATICFLHRERRRPVRVQEYVETCLQSVPGIASTRAQPYVGAE